MEIVLFSSVCDSEIIQIGSIIKDKRVTQFLPAAKNIVKAGYATQTFLFYLHL